MEQRAVVGSIVGLVAGLKVSKTFSTNMIEVVITGELVWLTFYTHDRS